MRIVIDTNVVISSFLIENSSAQPAYLKALKYFTICDSTESTKELMETFLRPKFDKYLSHEKRL